MSRQEKIREGMAMKLSYCSATEWEELDGAFKVSYFEEADRLLNYLKSEGMVLKVKKELPTRHLHISRTSQESYYLGKQDMLEAGFTAYEELI